LPKDAGDTTVIESSGDIEFNRGGGVAVENVVEQIVREGRLVDVDRLSELNSSYSSYLEDILKSGSINTLKLYSLLSKRLNIRLYTNYRLIEERVKLIDVERLSPTLMRALNVILFNDGEIFELLVSNPYEYSTIDYVENILGQKVEISLAQEYDIKRVLKRVRVGSEYSRVVMDGLSGGFTRRDLEIFESSDGDTQLPIIEFVQFIILEAKKIGASDIHIEPTEDEMVIRYRVDGVLQTEFTLPIRVHREVISRIKILSDMNVAEKRLPQDGRFDISDRDGESMDVRVSTFPTVYGEKVVMRLLEQEALKPSLEDLNMNIEDLELFRDSINSPYGLILITGPTGSGKTTTLYSALSTIDKSSKNVLTIEDPVEYRLDGVHQMQINEKIGLTFANGLKTVLRQDPDVIMVGEMRDLDTANMAIQASLTGHVVFSTLHTNDSIGIVIRLINMGVEPFLVASAVSLAVAQRLVRKVCVDCIEYMDGEALREELRRSGVTDSRLRSLNIDIDDDLDFAYGRGCASCRGTGYSGRIAIFELFKPTVEINREILKPDFDEARIREIAIRDGMKSLLDRGLELVEEGVTTISEVIRVIGD